MTIMELASRPVSMQNTVLAKNAVEELMESIPAWSLGEHAIERELRFKTFWQAMEFVNKVANLADEADHHPAIFISYTLVQLTLTTHRAGGLTMKDFILAAKIDHLVD